MLSAVFEEIDSSDDQLITVDEFKRMIPKLKQWGVTIDEGEASAVFSAIDKDGSGEASFEEFQRWAIRAQLDRDDDDDP